MFMIVCRCSNWSKKTCIKKESTEEIYFDNMGKFLPLSVWSTMGYGAEAMEANSASKDIRFDPVLGKVYRVVTMETGDIGGHVGTIMSETMSSKGIAKVVVLTQETFKNSPRSWPS